VKEEMAAAGKEKSREHTEACGVLGLERVVSCGGGERAENGAGFRRR